MDFDKFLEKDIIEFLDEQSQKVAEKAAGLREEEFDMYEITQDYTKDLHDALKEGDLRKAQKVFEDVKGRYTRAPNGSLSKKRLYTIMEEIYEKIKDYEEKEEGKKDLFDTIKEYEKSGLFTKPEVFKAKKSKSSDLILGIISRKEKELEKLTSKKDLNAEDLKKAIKGYREIKTLVMKIPKTHSDEKAKVFESALSWYYTLKKLKEEYRKKEGIRVRKMLSSAGEAKERVPVEEELGKVRGIKHSIVESHTKIADYLRKKELRKSIDEYRRLKKLCEAFPREMEEEKTALLADALSLYESIKKLKESLEKRKFRDIHERLEERSEDDEKGRLREKIQNRLAKVRGFLAQKDSASAGNEYNIIKELFNKYPNEPIEDKKKLYDEILKAHSDIKLLENDLKTKSPVYKTTMEKVGEIKRIVQEAHTLLDSGVSDQSTHKILEAKHKVQMLPDEAFDEKYSLLKEIEKLEHKLLFVKNLKNINAQNTIST